MRTRCVLELGLGRLPSLFCSMFHLILVNNLLVDHGPSDGPSKGPRTVKASCGLSPVAVGSGAALYSTLHEPYEGSQTMKILAHPNDSIGKVFGVENSGLVRGIGRNVCPSATFGLSRHSISHANVSSYNNLSHQPVEDLEKHVETLVEKLTEYEEAKEKPEETKKWLAQNEYHLVTLHRFLQAKFGSELPTFNLDSS
uniref:Uncharacterized protein n=1 Tax=Solanum tuberosum TaxID=4113 RepID=M1DM66_SOLTU